MPVGEIDRLITRLEHFHQVVRGDDDERKGGEQVGSALGMSRTACLRQTDAVRQAIKERERCIKAGKAHAPEGIAATAAVRRHLNELGVSAETLRKAFNADKNSRGGTAKMWEDSEVSEVLRNVDEVVASEAKRSGTQRAADRAKPWIPNISSLEDSGGVARAPLPQDPALQESLLQIQERDAAMEGSLDAIQAGLGRLRGLATDMNAEVKMQSIMIDEIASKAQHADAELRNLNKNLKKKLEDAGGVSRVLLNLLLLLLLLSLACFIYSAIKDAGGFVWPPV